VNETREEEAVEDTIVCDSEISLQEFGVCLLEILHHFEGLSTLYMLREDNDCRPSLPRQ